jgi:catechol 2,3-dioxygenase-like lactoylglutathione lyase family enzyme
MGVTGTLHTGLTVADLERSLKFWRDLLGLEVVMERVMDAPYVGEMVGYPGVEMNAAILGVPGGHQVELIEYVNAEGPPIDGRTGNPGAAHICLNVTDVAELHAQIKAAGYQTVTPEPVLSTAGPNKGRPFAYVIDPDGFRIELAQLPFEPS